VNGQKNNFTLHTVPRTPQLQLTQRQLSMYALIPCLLKVSNIHLVLPAVVSGSMYLVLNLHKHKQAGDWKERNYQL